MRKILVAFGMLLTASLVGGDAYAHLTHPLPHARTYELRIFPYCKPGTFCGYLSFAVLEANIRKTVQEVNVQWAHTGISFWPNVQNLDSNAPSGTVKHCSDGDVNYEHADGENQLCEQDSDCPESWTCVSLPSSSRYWQVESGCAKDEVGGVLRHHWQVNVREKINDAIPIFLLEGFGDNKNTCCGGTYGIYCNPRSGYTWSHELGHVFCGCHTFQGKILDLNGNPVGYQNHYPDVPEYPGGILHQDGDGPAGCGTYAASPILDTPPDRGSFERLARTCSSLGVPVPNSISCNQHSQCEAKYGMFTTCDVCADLVCSGDNTIVCKDDTKCAEEGAGSCICNPHMDQNADGSFRENHYWCSTSQKTDVDDGSLHSTRCDIECNVSLGGTPAPIPGPLPKPEIALSYYSSKCRGPYVYKGTRYDAFSPDAVTNIHTCQSSNYPNLTDACNGLDQDHDGVCDANDSCPSVQNLNTQSLDLDMDGDSDACDNCPGIKNADQANNDGDKKGDVCDDDDDNDGCKDVGDQHPLSSVAKSGNWVYTPSCPDNLDPNTYESEGGTDTDGDGFENCADLDDDNDGKCDDAVSAVVGDPGVPPGGCLGPDPCPLCNESNPPSGDPLCLSCHRFHECPDPTQFDWWLICQFTTTCEEFLLKFTKVINPDPLAEIRLDNFQILGQTIYASPIPNAISSETATAIATLFSGGGTGCPPNCSFGLSAAGRLQGADQERVRLEIWRRATEGEPEKLVAVVGEYDHTELEFGPLGRGQLVRLVPTIDPAREAETLYMDNLYTFGLNLGGELSDGDRDGRLDVADNCSDVANDDQFDSDGDGFGNRCDPDLDNDCVVTTSDVSFIKACEGADLKAEPDLEPDPDPRTEEPHVGPIDTVAVQLAEICQVADLNGDGLVDTQDVDQVQRAIGTDIGHGCVSGATPPPSKTGCISPAKLKKAKVIIKNIDRDAGLQKLEFSGETVLSHPFDPTYDPAERGMRIVLRTSRGRTVLDTDIPPGGFDKESRAGWKSKPERGRAKYLNKAGIGGLTEITLRWFKAKVAVEVTGKKGNFKVEGSELPLFVQITFDALRAATDQCAETDFLTLSCRQNRSGNAVIC